MAKRSKVTKAKAVNKTKVTQRVTVNIGRGRSKAAPRMPPRPPVQIFNSMPAPQGESMFQSAQLLSRLLEPVNLRLDALVNSRSRGAEPQAAAPNQNPPNPDPQLAEDNNRQGVVNQPDQQMVQPDQALVESGPLLLNDERAIALNKSGGESAEPAFDYDNFTLGDLNKLYVSRKKDNKSAIPTLEEVLRHFQVPFQKFQRTKEILTALLVQRLKRLQ